MRAQAYAPAKEEPPMRYLLVAVLILVPISLGAQPTPLHSFSLAFPVPLKGCGLLATIPGPRPDRPQYSWIGAGILPDDSITIVAVSLVHKTTDTNAWASIGLLGSPDPLHPGLFFGDHITPWTIGSGSWLFTYPSGTGFPFNKKAGNELHYYACAQGLHVIGGTVFYTVP